ncbi:MAG: ribosome silencing factor [Bowdeniella nasicola]|nr:ribosome silencing factor [Bowdeniella nasicola]
MPETTPFASASALIETAASAALSKNATNVIALDVAQRLPLTDAFVIATGDTERQVQAIVDAVEEAMHKAGVRRLRSEGYAQGRWVLTDFGDVIVHVLHRDEREEYALERLWAECPARHFSEEETSV